MVSSNGCSFSRTDFLSRLATPIDCWTCLGKRLPNEFGRTSRKLQALEASCRRGRLYASGAPLLPRCLGKMPNVLLQKRFGKILCSRGIGSRGVCLRQSKVQSDREIGQPK